MHPLTDRDYRSALQVVADVCSERDLRGFQQSVVSRLADLIPSDVVSFNLVGTSGLLAVDEPAGTCTPALRAVLPPLLKEHPMLPYGLLRGDARPYRLSDFRSERQFAATALPLGGVLREDRFAPRAVVHGAVRAGYVAYGQGSTASEPTTVTANSSSCGWSHRTSSPRIAVCGSSLNRPPARR